MFSTHPHFFKGFIFNGGGNQSILQVYGCGHGFNPIYIWYSCICQHATCTHTPLLCDYYAPLHQFVKGYEEQLFGKLYHYLNKLT